jgi:hypothetical protein
MAGVQIAIENNLIEAIGRKPESITFSDCLIVSYREQAQLAGQNWFTIQAFMLGFAGFTSYLRDVAVVLGYARVAKAFRTLLLRGQQGRQPYFVTAASGVDSISHPRNACNAP